MEQPVEIVLKNGVFAAGEVHLVDFLIVFGVFIVVLVEIEIDKDVRNPYELLVDELVSQSRGFHGLRVPLVGEAHEGEEVFRELADVALEGVEGNESQLVAAVVGDLILEGCQGQNWIHHHEEAMAVQLRVVEFDENVDWDEKSLVGDDHLHLDSIYHLVLPGLNEGPQVVVVFIRN